MKKTFVLVVLFVLPLVAYLFFASGINNFGKLPVLTENVADLSSYHPETTLNNKITILGFPGDDLSSVKAKLFNLNQKIYKPFHEFYDFQMVMVFPDGMQSQAAEVREELGKLTNAEKWRFLFVPDSAVAEIFRSLETNLDLDANYGSPFVFIVDKERKLRGRTNDEDEGVKYGFNTTSVAELNNKMEDDVKIILAEYRLALKKNNADR